MQRAAPGAASWGHEECVAFLRSCPAEWRIPTDALAAAGTLCGAELLSLASSTRELRDMLNLTTAAARVGFETKLRAEIAPSAPGVSGGAFSAPFLAAVAPLYDAHMGAENLGTALYALIRFAKPGSVVEIGAGLTSAFILQALADNDAETRAIRAVEKTAAAKGGVQVAGMPPGTPTLGS